jgi:hypothetical protein
MSKMKLILAAAALSLGASAAEAAPQTGLPALEPGTAHDAKILVEARGRGYHGRGYHGPGGDYYKQQYPGPNCYPYPHYYYGWICY